MRLTWVQILIGVLCIVGGMSISAVAAYYSITGLMVIFSGAAGSVMIMGIALEIGKLIASAWLKINWQIAPWPIRIYLIAAVMTLMAITSMGIFGFLSKSHADQKLQLSTAQQELTIYDQQLSIKQVELDAANASLQREIDRLARLDERIDRASANEDTVSGRRLLSNLNSQRKELSETIDTAQTAATEVMEQMIEIRSTQSPFSQKVETLQAEVGPLAYIAQLIYGSENTEHLEKAVIFVIIILVLVFDPLALVLLLAGLHSFQQTPTPKKEPEPQLADTSTQSSPPAPPPNLFSNLTDDQGPLFTQNEEQETSSVWSRLKNVISQREYNEISQERATETQQKMFGKRMYGNR
jgi:hypothetical protein